MIELKKDELVDIAGPLGNIVAVLTPCTNQEAARPVLIVAHGFRGSKEGGGRAAYLAKIAGEIVHVLRFDFNGSQLLTKQIAELEAVICYVKARFAGSRIILLGRSLGGSAALVAAERDPMINALALWATPHDLRGTFRKALGEVAYQQLEQGIDLYLNDERGEMTLTASFLRDLDRYNLPAILQQWQKRPLLIIHGEKDETVVLEQAQLAFSWAGLPKKLVVIPRADHSFSAHGN
ncbi:MAG: alpha/beta hydrolase, partial [Acidaminococcaceae bacterium]